jgi:xylulokinase
VLEGVALNPRWLLEAADHFTGRSLHRPTARAAADRRRWRAVRALVPVDRTFKPVAAHREVDDRLFAEFPRLHEAQEGILARLNGPAG